mgnify:FL=1
MGGITTSGSFVDSTSIQGRAGYFFKENWGIEFVMAKNSPARNDTFKSIENAGAGLIAFFNAVESYSGAMLMWSPFYAKINTFNDIIYFDWIFGIGYAAINTVDNRIQAQVGISDPTLTSDSASGLLLNMGMRFYLSESWSLRMDLTPLLYNGFSREPNSSTNEEEFYSHYDFTVGLNYAF